MEYLNPLGGNNLFKISSNILIQYHSEMIGVVSLLKWRILSSPLLNENSKDS